jgi:hypothetical protein
MFGVQNFGSTHSGGLFEEYEPETSLYKIAKFDISTFIDDREKKLRGSFNYATSLYTEPTILGFIKTYKTILDQLGNLCDLEEGESDSRIQDLQYLNEEQYNYLVHSLNETDKEYPNKTIQVF